MKKIFTFLLSVFSSVLFSQAPQLINYQGVARTSAGDPIVNTTIALKFELLQASPTGSVLFTEVQSVGTGTLGVFSTQIGKVNTTDFKNINWKAGDLFLRVSIDPTNGTSFTVAGTQQLVSVPFAMHAQSVPTSYTNNVLSIGTDSYALSTYTAGAGISITGGSVITNAQPDQTVTIAPGNSNVAVAGTYPNFSVSATPSLSLLSANTLSISEGNSVTIAPSLSFTNSVLTVGPPTNTVSLPAAPNTSLVGTGAVNVTTLAANSYSLNVAPVTLTAATNVSITGAYPNFTIASTPSLTLLSANSLSITGGNSVAIAPSLGLTGNTLNVGPASNSIVIPSPTVQGTGAAVVTPTTGLNFVVNVPSTTLNASGGGISISSPGSNTFNLVVPSPTPNSGTNVSVTSTHTNFVINATPSLSLLSPNTLSISGANSVAIAPSLTYTNNVLTVGPNSNTVSIPTSSATIVGGGIVQVTSPSANSYSITAPTPSISSGPNVQVAGTYPSFTVSATPSLALSGNTLSISGGTPVVLNSYTAGSGLVMSGGPDYTLSAVAATTSITGAGAASVSPASGNSFTVNVPATNLVSTAGIATVNATGTNSFDINVPAPVYNQASGMLTTGSASSNITPTLAYGGNVLTVGPATNTVLIPGSTVSLQATGIASVSPASGNSFTLDVPSPSISVTGNTINITQGSSSSSASIAPPTLLTLGTNNNSLTAGGNTVTLNTYTVNGTGLSMTGGPDYTITATSSAPTIAGTGAANVTPLTGTSFTVDVPATALTSTGGIANITSAGTNSFNINVPSPAYNPSTGALTTGTAVANITQTLSVSGNTLTVGPASNTISLPTSSVALQGSGAAVVSGIGNNYTVAVAEPTITGTGATAVLGTYPNFTVATPVPQATVTGSGAAAVSPSTGLSFQVDVPQSALTATSGIATVSSAGTNSFDINVPAPSYNASTGALTTGTAVANITPTLSVSGNTLTVGPASNTISLPTSSVALQGSGAAVVSGTGNNYTVAVAEPTITGTGATAVLGTYPNFTVATPVPQATVTGSGAAAVSPSTGLSFQVDVPQSALTATSGIATVNSAGTNSFDINVPAPAYNAATGALTTGTAVANITPTLSVSGNMLTVGPASNTVSLPVSSVSLQGIDAAVVSGSGNNYTVAVASPTIVGDGATAVLGTYPNYTVSTPVPQATVTGSGAAIVTPNTGLSFQVDVPQSLITANTGVAMISSSGTNSFDINVPAPLYNPSTGVLTMGPSLTPITQLLSYSNDVLTSGPASNSVLITQTPPPSISGMGAASVLSSGNSFTIDVPAINLSATGASSITGVFPNLTVETASTEITGQGAVTVSGTFPSYTISADSPSITGTGLAVVTPTTGNNFVVDVPVLSYTPSTGDLGSGTNIVSILPPLTFSNNILTSGPSSNSVDISGTSAWSQASNAVTLTSNSNSVGIGTSVPGSKLDVQNSFAGNNGQTMYAEMNSSYSSSGGGVFAGNFQNNYNGTAGPQVLSGVHGRLVLSGSNTSQYPSAGWFNGTTSGGSHTNLMGLFGSVETVGGSVANAYGGYFDHLGSSGITNGYGVYTGNISGANKWSFYANDPGARSFFAGKVGIGNNNPTENLQVESTTSGAQLSIVSPSPQISTLSFGASYDHFLGQIKYSNISGKMSFYTTGSDKLVIDGSGYVGINTSAPQAELHVNGNTAATSIKLSSTSSSNGILLQSNGSSANLINYENTSMYFGTNGSNRLTIMNNGNVGVGLGVLFPQSQLGVYGNAAIGSSYASSFVSPTNGLIVEGKLGIGTPAPAQQVEISSPNVAELSLISTSALASSISFGHTGNHFMGNIHYDLATNVMNFWTNNTPNRMMITSVGRVGINNASPTATLDVAGTVKIADGNQGNGKVLTSDASGNATWNQVLPAGMVMAYAGGTVPAGWLLCDGTAVSRTTFATLFAAVGTAWGIGDGTSTFNLPDMRGMFLRGVASGSNNDPDRGSRTATNAGNAGDAVGSVQNDQLQSHNHSIGISQSSSALLGAAVMSSGGSISTSNTGGNETRPKNVYVQYIIKQ